jgi:hypothetical protein
MINSQRRRNPLNRFKDLLAAVAIFVMLSMATAHAQAVENPAPLEGSTAEVVVHAAEVARGSSAQFLVKPWVADNVRPSLVLFSNRVAMGWDPQPKPGPQTPTVSKQRSIRRKVLGAIVGATGGFFAGGYLGATIEGDCDCDDPGLKGAVIGAPIGAVTGGILGYKFLF